MPILRPAPGRLGFALLILCAAFAGAVVLHHHIFVAPLGGWDLGWRPVHPWWVDAATLALCLLGVAGATDVLGKAPHAVAIGYTTASALFLAAGVAAMTDRGLLVTTGTRDLPGRTTLAVAFLLLGCMAAALAWTFRSRLRRSAHPRT